MARFEWTPWGDGSSADGFGNICDNVDEVIVAKDVPENYGIVICDALNSSRQEWESDDS